MVDARYTSGHRVIPLPLQPPQHPLQKAPRTGADGKHGVGLEEADEKEGHIVLPGDAPERGEIRYGDHVAVAVLLVADPELLEIGGVVHVPAEDDAAEPKAGLGNGQEFLLLHQLAPQDAVDVDAGELDLVIVFQELWQALQGNSVCRRHDDD